MAEGDLEVTGSNTIERKAAHADVWDIELFLNNDAALGYACHGCGHVPKKCMANDKYKPYCEACAKPLIEKGVTIQPIGPFGDGRIGELKLKCRNKLIDPSAAADVAQNGDEKAAEGDEKAAEAEAANNECPWTGPLKDWQAHNDSDCTFTVQQCPHCKAYDCSKSLLAAHDEKCPEKSIPCELDCGLNVLRKNMEPHKTNDCEQTVLKCGIGCEVELVRKNKQTHETEQCPKRIVTCAFKKYGCPQQDVKAEELAMHDADNEIRHLQLQVQFLQNSVQDQVGVIKMYSGDTKELVEGWKVCDGTQGTVDLSAQFIQSGDDDQKEPETYALCYIVKTPTTARPVGQVQRNWGNMRKFQAQAAPVAEPEPEPEPEQQQSEPQAADPEPQAADPEPQPEPAVDAQEDEKTADADVVVVRKELRSMSQEETDRFFGCVDKMLENKDGPGTSEFYRCASYHGQPAPIYCQHGRETFPGWHRIYLMDFEKALQAADKALGRDGSVFLPYWDWTVAQEDGLPAVIRQRFKGWPGDFWPVELQQESRTKELRRNSDQGVTAQLRAWQVVRSATDSLLATQHWAHASTQFSGHSNYPSLENAHNDVHAIVGGNGGQMGSVAWAAYDIAFWLHHCNVDRMYESYLRLEPDSHEEFRSFQTDLFGSAYAPFEKADGTKYTSKDTFDTKALGYAYAALFEPPAQNQLREPPTFILFAGVKVSEFASKCYQIHAYVVDAAKEAEFKEPATINDIDYESPNYAGGAGIFGRGMECPNCATRPPQDIAIDIGDTLRAAGIDRYSAKAKIYVLETTEDSEALQPLSATPLPEPTITGPLFSNRDAADLLDEADKATNNPKEVEALQRFLQKFGYYAPERKVDGDFGPHTRQAVVDYQEATGDLTADGVAGPVTRNAIVKKKRCANLDPFAKNEVTDTAVGFAQAAYAKQKEIKYSIGAQPGYLKRDQVEAAIAKACSAYDAATSLSFVKVDDEKDADIKFSFTLCSREDDPTRYDGIGGVLGRGGTGYVEFDMAERWTIGMGDADEQLSDLGDRSTWYRGQPVISLYYTALHELGHALGLVHSKDPNDVMSPWYNPKQTQLSANDAEAVKQIVVVNQQ